MQNELYEQTYKNKNHFSFGKNWQRFLDTLDDRKIKEAEDSLANFLGGRDQLAGKTFVDIGSGSGLFSLAAYRLGVKKVVSVDIDDFSLNCTNYLRESFDQKEHWEVHKGSALDQNFLQSLGTFDIVYSWGVLHHTGDMYQALLNVEALLNPDGKLYIALYNDNKRFLEGSSPFWVKMKRLYNQSPWLVKKLIEGIYALYYLIGLLMNWQNPITYIRHYHTLRGMDFWTDIKDWLGGYPYEYASVEKIVFYFKEQGFECTKINPARSIGCNEFLFNKRLS